jgi:hypothetical protein
MTSVRQPFAEMGAEAARMVLALAAGEELPQRRIELADDADGPAEHRPTRASPQVSASLP